MQTSSVLKILAMSTLSSLATCAVLDLTGNLRAPKSKSKSKSKPKKGKRSTTKAPRRRAQSTFLATVYERLYHLGLV